MKNENNLDKLRKKLIEKELTITGGRLRIP